MKMAQMGAGKRFTLTLVSLGLVSTLGACAHSVDKNSSQVSPAAQPSKSAAAQTFNEGGAPIKDGSYQGQGNGRNGLITLTLAFKDGKLDAVEAQHTETQGIGDEAIKKLKDEVLSRQNFTFDSVAGASLSSAGFREALADALQQAGVDPAVYGYDKAAVESLKSAAGSEHAQVGSGLSATKAYPWDAAPKEGFIEGAYFKVEERFRQGHLGVMEAALDGDKISYVEFNETGRPNYYLRLWQNQNKRLSEYNANMKDKKGAAWIESVLKVEAQMLADQRLTGDFDTVAGASNSVQQAMLPLAAKLDESIKAAGADASNKTNQPHLYRLVKKTKDGMIGVLKVVKQGDKIIDLHYDEVFPADPADIKAEVNKQFHGLSKYDSVFYEEPSRIGFNVAMDALRDKVLETQDLFNLDGLPATEDSGDYKKGGYTKRNTAWDNYLELAKELQQKMK